MNEFQSPYIDGDVISAGEPDEVARNYYRINFEAAASDPEALAMSQDALAEAGAEVKAHTKVVEAQIEDADGNSVASLEQGTPIRFRAVVEAVEELRNPVFSFLCSNRNGTHVFGFRRSLERSGEENVIVPAGEQVELAGSVENPLAPGKYVLTCWISRDAERGEVAFQAIGLADFMVYGTGQPLGLVEVDADVEARTVGGGGS